MKQAKDDSKLETDLTGRRRWVPLRGMDGALDPLRSIEEGGGANAGYQPGSGQPMHGSSGAGRPVEWLIIGGGIHGTYLSHFLTTGLGLAPDALRVLDPHDRPLEAWLRNAENVGMEYLRSAAVHHLDLPSLSLKRRAGMQGERRVAGYRPEFIPPYGRPLLELFNRHAFEVIGTHGLDSLRVRGRACGLRPVDGGYEVEYRVGGASPAGPKFIQCSNVLLAIGMDDATCWPEWAKELRSAGVRVHHVLDAGFRRSELRPWRRAIVYGGGLSGAQLSSALARQSPGSVTLISGHEMEVHLFDSEPSWQGGNFMASFAAVRDPAGRREIIRRERHRGSLTPEALDELDHLQSTGALRVVTTDPGRLEAAAEGSSVHISAAGERFEADLLILATGYDTARPGGKWLDRAIDEMELPCAPCGYPIVGPGLEWRRGLYVSGPLAELELGPVARNISGAHRAAARLEYFLPGRDRRTVASSVHSGG